VECGVFKGAGWMYWLKLLDLYARGEQKRVVGFDTFGSFADSLLDYERESAERFVVEAAFGGVNPDSIMEEALNSGFKNAELIAGDVANTLPVYVENNPGFRISLLHLDFDTYHGTKVALENLYELVTPGGIILLDEYGKRGWGESDAIDEFFRGKNIGINAVRGSFQPTAYIRKELL
jgi:SAM-dependent methyltransferase